MQTGPERGRQITRIDVRWMSLEERKPVLAWWFNHHLHCTDGNGHSWRSHQWISDVKAWLWGPCEKCSAYRLTQTKGNYVEWHPTRRHYEVLLVDDDFKLIENRLHRFEVALMSDNFWGMHVGVE